MTTLYESSTQNMNDNIRDVWTSQFSGSTTIGTEGIRKSVMTAIALARGLTIHIYIAAYVLLFYPILFERGITLILLWMLICAVRSVIVNFVALVTGCIICSSYPDLKPVCFEFGATKAIEIACSAYMWLSVNDFYINLRSRRISLVAKKMLAKTTQISDSDMSLLSSDLSFIGFHEDVVSSSDSMMVKASVDWLMKSAFGTNHQTQLVEEAVGTQRFLNMSAAELKELQNRIKNKLCEDFGMQSLENEYENNVNVEKLVTQTTSSQTQEPSRRLQQRLSKTEILPTGSKLEAASGKSEEYQAQGILPKSEERTEEMKKTVTLKKKQQ